VVHMIHRLAWGHRSSHQGSRTLGYRAYRGNPQTLVHTRLQVVGAEEIWAFSQVVDIDVLMELVGCRRYT
jgi:hypothetical protein